MESSSADQRALADQYQLKGESPQASSSIVLQPSISPKIKIDIKQGDSLLTPYKPVI